MAVKMGRKQNAKNLLMNIVAFGVQFIISFYISPKIVGKVGASAYGFIGLANDFVNYAAIISSVFNSVAARFIANSFYKEEYDKANHYFNSLIVANIIISGVLGIIAIVLVPNLNTMLVIPPAIVLDVKITFALVFAAYIVQLVTTVFTTSTFVTNRTDIQGVRNIISQFIRLGLIVVFLNFVSVKIYWISLASLIAAIVVAILNFNLTHILTPELKIDLKYANKKYAYELAKNGSWMAFTSISTILLRGLDLTIANITIGDYEMGLLSIARTIPNNVTSIIATIAPIFTPIFISYYAKGDRSGLVKNLNESVKTIALILYVPITGFIVFSRDFYSLWQKSLTQEEISIIVLLSTITVIQAYFNSTTATMAQISVVTNKLKLPVFVSFGCGIISVIIELALIYFSNLGVYSIVISTSIVMILRYIFFNPIYAASCLGEKPFHLYKNVIKAWLTIIVLLVTMFSIRNLFPIYSWKDLLIAAMVSGGIGYLEIALLMKYRKVQPIISRLINRKEHKE